MADEGEGGAAFQGEEGFEDLSGDDGFGVAGAGLEAEKEGAVVALHFGEGAGGIGADGGGGFGEGVNHVAEHLVAREVGGQAGRARSAGLGGGGIVVLSQGRGGGPRR